MNQHVDVIYMKKDNNLYKCVCFTLLQKCDQNMAQTLSVMDHLCKEIKANFLNVKTFLVNLIMLVAIQGMVIWGVGVSMSYSSKMVFHLLHMILMSPRKGKFHGIIGVHRPPVKF